MSILQPLPVADVTRQLTVNVPPPVTCCICNKRVETHADAVFAHSCLLVISNAGHPALPAFQCPFNEHATCNNPDCVGVAFHACIDEHMLPMLRALHKHIGMNTENKG